jgi:O-antigen ligase
VTVTARTLRGLIGALLGWWVVLALVAPEVPPLTAGAAAVIAAATLWNPAAGLMLTAGLTPAAVFFAAPPIRAPEIFAWAFLATWLLSVWRPISHTPLPRAVAIPAALYAAALAASWLMLTVSAAPGVSASALPEFLVHSIPPDHLIFSSPEPETWTLLQMTTGVAVLLASMSVIAPNAAHVARLGWTLILCVTLLAAATLVDVAVQWAGMNYEGWFLLRYVRGERFSLHMADLNAAGSLYVLGGMVAAAIAAARARGRDLAIAALAVIAPAFWLAGSRTAFVATLAGFLILAVIRQRRPATRVQLAAAAAGLVLLVIAGAFAVNWELDVQGSAANSARLRSQFTQTSARMFASAPLFGVGVGKYFDRSAEFMPAEVRAIYGNENAHNYFAQQFAELGIIGGAMFLWLVCSLLGAGWRGVRTRPSDTMLAGLLAAIGAYLLTCLTGHPLLVPAAALPFWVAAGALTGAIEHSQQRSRKTQRHVAVAVCAVLAAGVGSQVVAYANRQDTPPESGFHGQETSSDGDTFRWMTRHAVTYVPNESGFVRLRVRAPTLPKTRPMIIETAIAGEVVDRRELPAGEWVSYDIPSRRPTAAPFRRVDLRVNQWWAQDVALGTRQARRPVALMVGAIQWIPLGGR